MRTFMETSSNVVNCNSNYSNLFTLATWIIVTGFMINKIAIKWLFQMQPSRGAFIGKAFAMSKCDYNKLAKQLNWNHTSSWVFSCKFPANF